MRFVPDDLLFLFNDAPVDNIVEVKTIFVDVFQE